MRHRGSYRALTKRIKRLIKHPINPAAPSCRFSRSKAGMRTMVWTYNERVLADLEHLLRGLIDTDEPAAAQLAEALEQLLNNGDAIPETRFRPIVLVPIDDHVRIHSGTGDEVILICTDGTTMTGAEYMEHEFGDILEVAAFPPKKAQSTSTTQSAAPTPNKKSCRNCSARHVRFPTANTQRRPPKPTTSTPGASVG